MKGSTIVNDIEYSGDSLFFTICSLYNTIINTTVRRDNPGHRQLCYCESVNLLFISTSVIKGFVFVIGLFI